MVCLVAVAMSTDVAIQAAAGTHFSGERDTGAGFRPASTSSRGTRQARRRTPCSGRRRKQHLFDSGRSAVAHAGLDGVILDPDIPGGRRRIADDVDVVAGIAVRYLKVEAGVPDES
jgi:hypothetical protein